MGRSSKPETLDWVEQQDPEGEARRRARLATQQEAEDQALAARVARQILDGSWDPDEEDIDLRDYEVYPEDAPDLTEPQRVYVSYCCGRDFPAICERYSVTQDQARRWVDAIDRGERPETSRIARIHRDTWESTDSDGRKRKRDRFFWQAPSGRWTSTVQHNMERISIGHHDTLADAQRRWVEIQEDEIQWRALD